MVNSIAYSINLLVKNGRIRADLYKMESIMNHLNPYLIWDKIQLQSMIRA